MRSWSPRLLVVLTLVSLVAVAALAAGCGKVKQAKQAVETARSAGKLAQTGKATFTDEKGHKVAVQVNQKKEGEGTWAMTDEKGNKTTATVSSDMTEKDVGLKFYPGATVKSGTTVSSTGAKAGQMVTVTLTTQDGFDKVAKFYKDNYSQGNQVIEGPDALMIMFSGDTSGKMVSVSKDKESGEVTIVLTAGMGKM